jgi:ammonium transporter, Amt family
MDSLTCLGASALLVRVGLALYIVGLSRSKNSVSATVRVICDLCVASLAFCFVGAGFFWQMNTPIIGFRWGFLFGGASDPAALFFQTTAILTATAVVTGALAERGRLLPVVAASALLAGIILPITGNWVWYGWLRRMGFVDVAGAAALHVAAATCAGAGAMILGPRTGKYHRDGSSSVIPGHSMPLAVAGMFLMLVGWIGYVVGSGVLRQEPLASGPADVFFAAVAAGAGALLYSQWRYEKIDLLLILIGIVGGLVAISAGGGAVGVRAAIIIGGGAGVLSTWGAVALDLHFRVDDPIGLLAPQFIGGVWGTLAAAIFCGNSPLERLRLLAVQATGLIAIVIFSFALSAAFFHAFKKAERLRVREADEVEGLDLVEHDIGAYPDFQQNTIRSFHLRET